MSDDSRQFVSVIVPVYDDYGRLQSCLEALERQEFDCERYEILVVDNGTPSGRMEPVETRFENVRRLVEPRGGSYTARNAGLAEASGELLAFTDADCIPDEHWLAEGVAALERHPDAGLVGGRIELFPESPDAPTAAETWELVSGFPQRHYIRDLDFAATANMWTRREVFDEVGAFEDSLRSGGDREWGERVAEAGFELVYAEDVQVKHPARRSLGELIAKTVRTTRGDYDRREVRGELGTVRRAGEILRHTGELAILPLRVGTETVRSLDSPKGALQFAAAEGVVQATKKAVAIAHLGRHLFKKRRASVPCSRDD